MKFKRKVMVCVDPEPLGAVCVCVCVGREGLMGRVSIFQDKKSSADWLYSNLNVLNTTEPYTGNWLSC